MIKIKTNCQDLPKISCLDRFLDLDRDFWDWKVVTSQNQDISIVETNFLKVSRFSQLSRLTLCQSQDWNSRSRPRQDKLRPPGLNFLFLFLSLLERNIRTNVSSRLWEKWDGGGGALWSYFPNKANKWNIRKHEKKIKKC